MHCRRANPHRYTLASSVRSQPQQAAMLVRPQADAGQQACMRTSLHSRLSTRLESIPMKLAQRTALVTGAGNGIGRAIATALGHEGARILIADMHNAEASAAEMVAAGIDAHGITMNVTSEEDVARMAEVASERFGSLDIVVNNAAIFSGSNPVGC